MTAARTLTDADVEAIAQRLAEIVAVKPASPWMTSEDVAELLAVNVRSVQNYAKTGALRSSRVGALCSRVRDTRATQHRRASSMRSSRRLWRRAQPRQTTRRQASARPDGR